MQKIFAKCAGKLEKLFDTIFCVKCNAIMIKTTLIRQIANFNNFLLSDLEYATRLNFVIHVKK